LSLIDVVVDVVRERALRAGDGEHASVAFCDLPVSLMMAMKRELKNLAVLVLSDGLMWSV
jgi:hypothetical protein